MRRRDELYLSLNNKLGFKICSRHPDPRFVYSENVSRSGCLLQLGRSVSSRSCTRPDGRLRIFNPDDEINSQRNGLQLANNEMVSSVAKDWYPANILEGEEIPSSSSSSSSGSRSSSELYRDLIIATRIIQERCNVNTYTRKGSARRARTAIAAAGGCAGGDLRGYYLGAQSGVLSSTLLRSRPTKWVIFKSWYSQTIYMSASTHDPALFRSIANTHITRM